MFNALTFVQLMGHQLGNLMVLLAVIRQAAMVGAITTMGVKIMVTFQHLTLHIIQMHIQAINHPIPLQPQATLPLTRLRLTRPIIVTVARPNQASLLTIQNRLTIPLLIQTNHRMILAHHHTVLQIRILFTKIRNLINWVIMHKPRATQPKVQRTTATMRRPQATQHKVRPIKHTALRLLIPKSHHQMHLLIINPLLQVTLLLTRMHL